MIDGTAARLVMLSSMMRAPAATAVLLEVDRRGDADRQRQRAVSAMTKMLPVSACQMPACDARRDEKLVMKFHDSRPAPSRHDVPDERAPAPPARREHEQRQRTWNGDGGSTISPADPIGRRGALPVRSRVLLAEALAQPGADQVQPNVPMNSSMPTAKIVRYSSVPCGVSPRLTCTM